MAAMAVLISLDWPGARVAPGYDWIAGPLNFVILEIMYGMPVVVCLYGMWLLDYLAKSRACASRQLAVAIVIICLLSGLGPTITIDQYECYRLGVPGFLLPYALVLLFWIPAWRMVKPDGCPVAASRPLFVRFILLFGGTTAIALVFRALNYLDKLNIELP